MRPHILMIFGIAMMAGSGSAISTRLGFSGLQSFLFAGFAVGIAILGMAPMLSLRARVAQLESRLATSNGDVERAAHR
jgi:hypothetical protein